MRWRAECFDKDENLLDVLETTSLHRMCELLESVFEEVGNIKSFHINMMEGDDD